MADVAMNSQVESFRRSEWSSRAVATALLRLRVSLAVLARLGQADRSDSCSKTDENCFWEYSFYYLPPVSDGGGPELDLYFNSAGVVSRVECAQSQ